MDNVSGNITRMHATESSREEQSEGQTSVDLSSETTVVTTLTFPREGFVLEQTLRDVPDARFRFVRKNKCGSSIAPSLLYVRSTTTEALEAALSSDQDVEHAELLTEFQHEYLYQVEWSNSVLMQLRMILRQPAVLLSAFGGGQDWMLRILYPSRDHVSSAVNSLNSFDAAFSVESIETFDGDPGDQCGISPKQWEALQAASELGYYQVPKETFESGVAEELGISHQALSERLRRGLETLIENTLVVE